MPYGDGSGLELDVSSHLRVERCPHCALAHPAIVQQHAFDTSPAHKPRQGVSILQWNVFVCQACGGLLGAALPKAANGSFATIPGKPPKYQWVIPAPRALSGALPERVAYYLGQAHQTLTSPSASVVMSAAAVDAILKAHGLKDGSLYKRIEDAVGQGIITKAMAKIAHDVRLDANNERHVDENASPPSHEDARRCFDFADALAEMIFVLPNRVTRAKT